jgi:hypothetical protein
MAIRSTSSPDGPGRCRPTTASSKRRLLNTVRGVAQVDDVDRVDRDLCAIVLIDVAASASAANHAQLRMRRDLYDLVQAALKRRDLVLESLPVTDTGDGLRIFLPFSRIRPADVIDLFVLGLAAGLRQHRQYVAECSRIRLRVAFDLGIVEPHLQGWVGDSLIRVARLVDAEPVRDVLESHTDLDLAAVVSDVMYRYVVEPGDCYLAADYFEPIRVRVKEFDARAWLLTRYASWPCGLCHETAA